MNKDVLQQYIALTSEHNLIMLIDIPFPVISTTQSLIPLTQIFLIGYSDISVHRSRHTLHFLLFDIEIDIDIDIFIATLVYMVYTSSILQRNINK